MKKLLLVSASVLALSVASAKASTTLDFNSLPYENLSSLDGVTFSVTGGPGGGGYPSTYPFGSPGLGNSLTGGYPTNEYLNMFFPGPISSVSGYFDNYGAGEGSGRGASTVTAYGPGNVVEGSAYLGGISEGGPFTVPGSDILELVFSNGASGSSSWQFAVNSIMYSAPEPASMALLGVGLGGLSMIRRRRRS